MLYYNHQRALKSLKFKTPWELVTQCYTDDPQYFKENTDHKIMGLNILPSSALLYLPVLRSAKTLSL